VASYYLETLDPEALASFDSMEGLNVVIPRPRPEPSTRPRLSALWIAGAIAAAAYGLHQLYRPMSAAIIAILLGASIRNLLKLPPAWIESSKGLAKRIIPATIVLTGASLNVTDVARVGGASLAVIAASIACATFTALAAGRLLGARPKTAMLVGCGTAICGTSAIIAAAPIIGADDDDLLISVSTVNLLGLLAMLGLPPAAMWWHMPQAAFGVWAGSTVHAVPQAVTTGYTYGTQAGALATLTKLVRVTMLAPYLIVLALTAHRKARVSIAKLLPLFIWGFLALAALNTLGLLPVLAFHPLGGVERQAPLAAVLNDAGTLLLTVSMAAMGIEVNVRSLLRTGVPALATGAVASAAQIALTFGLIHWLM
jgi:uncharacterized integral membrane protein (TIGR00698 family)